MVGDGLAGGDQQRSQMGLNDYGTFEVKDQPPPLPAIRLPSITISHVGFILHHRLAASVSTIGSLYLGICPSDPMEIRDCCPKKNGALCKLDTSGPEDAGGATRSTTYSEKPFPCFLFPPWY